MVRSSVMSCLTQYLFISHSPFPWGSLSVLQHHGVSSCFVLCFFASLISKSWRACLIGAFAFFYWTMPSLDLTALEAHLRCSSVMVCPLDLRARTLCQGAQVPPRECKCLKNCVFLWPRCPLWCVLVSAPFCLSRDLPILLLL